MDGGEECSSNESGWTKYIDPTSEDDENFNSDVYDDDDGGGGCSSRDHHHYHHHHNQGYNRRKKEDTDDDDGDDGHEDDDSIASDASSGPGLHDAEDDKHHGNMLINAGKGKKSSKVMNEKNKNEGKAKDAIFKPKKSTGYVLKQRQGKKPN